MTTIRAMHLSLIVLGINGLKIPLANELSSAFNRVVSLVAFLLINQLRLNGNVIIVHRVSR